MSCRIFLNQPLQTDAVVDLPDHIAHYLRLVMRQNVGDQVILFNGSGGEYTAVIETMDKRDCACRIIAFTDINREMTCLVHVVQAACRSEKIETVLQKGTELGAASFHITRSERSSLKLGTAKLDKRMQRWQKIVEEASEQSGRTVVPTVHWHHSLTEVSCLGLGLALHPHTSHSWHTVQDQVMQATDITLAIGPEGGWSNNDIDALNKLGFANTLFGPRVMRTETAAPALLAAIEAVRGV